MTILLEAFRTSAALAIAAALSCSSPAMVDTGGSHAEKERPRLRTASPECPRADASTMSGAARWGRAQGYIELLGCCVSPPVAQCQFLLSMEPRRIVIAVCNGERGSRRCVMNRTVLAPP